MTDIPIIFSAPMVRALLDGRKTMTRRLAWKPMKADPLNGTADDFAQRPSPWQHVKAGDRLWVRECVAFIDNSEFGAPSYFEYRADTDGKCLPGEWPAEERSNPDRPRWKPSIHMPRAASRLTLAVTATKIERLQDISESDAEAEGVTKVRDHCYVVKGFDYDNAGLCHSRPSIPFCKLWMHLHGEESWLANPEVVALTFTVQKANIETLAKAA